MHAYICTYALRFPFLLEPTTCELHGLVHIRRKINFSLPFPNNVYNRGFEGDRLPIILAINFRGGETKKSGELSLPNLTTRLSLLILN
jgi:hypothetical protein